MSTISSRDGRPRESRSSAAIRMPGVQKPHWSAWWRLNASCSGESIASPASDSTVSTVEPSAWTASRQQPRTETPSSRTVQAPQTPCSQPTCVPVRPRRCAEEVGQEQARLDLLDDDLAVDRDRDLRHAARSQARSSARSTSVPVRWRRYAAEAWIEPGGSTAVAASRPASSRRRLRHRDSRRPRARPRPARSAGRSPRRPTPARRGRHRRPAAARPPPSRARSRRPAARAPRTRRPRPAPAAARSSRRRARPARASSGSG